MELRMSKLAGEVDVAQKRTLLIEARQDRVIPPSRAGTKCRWLG